MKQGQLLLLSSGEYSDYGPIALTRTLKDFSANEALQEYLNEFPSQRDAYCAKQMQFVAWLSSHGFIEDIEYTEWNIGCYSNLEELAEDK